MILFKKNSIKKDHNYSYFLVFAFIFMITAHAQPTIIKDYKNRGPAAQTAVAATAITVHHVLMSQKLKTTREMLRQEIEDNYGKTTYDNASSFITSGTLNAANQIANQALGHMLTSTNAPYFTESKEHYLNNVNSDILDLVWLQLINHDKTTQAEKQKIYRARRELLAFYSQDQKESRRLLLLSGAALLAQNSDVLITTLKDLKIIK